jgi:hypothetical protein
MFTDMTISGTIFPWNVQKAHSGNAEATYNRQVYEMAEWLAHCLFDFVLLGPCGQSG